MKKARVVKSGGKSNARFSFAQIALLRRSLVNAVKSAATKEPRNHPAATIHLTIVNWIVAGWFEFRHRDRLVAWRSSFK